MSPGTDEVNNATSIQRDGPNQPMPQSRKTSGAASALIWSSGDNMTSRAAEDQVEREQDAGNTRRIDRKVQRCL
jgi:hypothetical protein